MDFTAPPVFEKKKSQYDSQVNNASFPLDIEKLTDSV